MENQTEEKREGVVRARFIGQHAEAAVKNFAEDDVIKPQHQQRREAGPQDTQITPAMAQLHGADRKLPPQVALAGEIGKRRSVTRNAHRESKNERTAAPTLSICSAV